MPFSSLFSIAAAEVVFFLSLSPSFSSSVFFCTSVLHLLFPFPGKIQGFKLPGQPKQLKLLLYADDNNLLLTTGQSIINLFKELENFRQASGCNINAFKTQGLTIGGAGIPDLPVPIQWNMRINTPSGLMHKYLKMQILRSITVRPRKKYLPRLYTREFED